MGNKSPTQHARLALAAAAAGAFLFTDITVVSTELVRVHDARAGKQIKTRRKLAIGLLLRSRNAEECYFATTVLFSTPGITPGGPARI